MPEINGKQVILVSTFESSKWWPLMPKLAELGTGKNWLEVLDWATVCALVDAAVKSWEFDGEPSDPNAVGKLDVFAELTPLVTEIALLIKQHQDVAKNPVERSTSP